MPGKIKYYIVLSIAAMSMSWFSFSLLMAIITWQSDCLNISKWLIMPRVIAYPVVVFIVVYSLGKFNNHLIAYVRKKLNN